MRRFIATSTARDMTKESRKDSNSAGDALFREAMRGVKPLDKTRPAPAKPAPKARAMSRRQDEQAALRESLATPPEDSDIETGEEMSFRRPSLPERDFRKLRRGQFSMREELDLHGLTVEEARLQLIDFMEECLQFGYRHVIIIHGKGFRSQSKPVIKPMVNRWLRQADEVLAFCSAQPKDGGTGAVYVLLRRGVRDE